MGGPVVSVFIQFGLSANLPPVAVELFSRDMERLDVVSTYSGPPRSLTVPSLPVYARLRFPSGRIGPLREIHDPDFVLSAESMGVDSLKKPKKQAAPKPPSGIKAASPKRLLRKDPAAMQEMMAVPDRPRLVWAQNQPIALANQAVLSTFDMDGIIRRSNDGRTVTLRRSRTANLAREPGQLTVECHSARLRVCLPGNLAHIKVQASESRDGVECVDIAYHTHSGWADALTEYLQNGDFYSAQSMLDATDQSERLLSDKFLDPYGAAVGAYFLLRSGERLAFPIWLRRLADEFPSLPDGAVIWAWYLIRQEQAIDEGLRYLRIAARRGTPVFAEGRRLLIDGLYRAGEAGHEFLRRKPDAAQRVIWASPLTAWREDEAPGGGLAKVSFRLRPAPARD